MLNGGKARIHPRAFKDMNIESIELGNNFGRLLSNTFVDLPKLKKITFSKKSLKTIDRMSFLKPAFTYFH